MNVHSKLSTRMNVHSKNVNAGSNQLSEALRKVNPARERVKIVERNGSDNVVTARGPHRSATGCGLWEPEPGT